VSRSYARAAKRALDPFNVSTAVDDPVASELSRLEVDVRRLTDRLTLPGGLTLSASQGLDLRQRQGRAMRAAVEAVMVRRGYARALDPTRKKWLQDAIDQSRETVNREMVRSLIRPRR